MGQREFEFPNRAEALYLAGMPPMPRAPQFIPSNSGTHTVERLGMTADLGRTVETTLLKLMGKEITADPPETFCRATTQLIEILAPVYEKERKNPELAELLYDILTGVPVSITPDGEIVAKYQVQPPEVLLGVDRICGTNFYGLDQKTKRQDDFSNVTHANKKFYSGQTPDVNDAVNKKRYIMEAGLSVAKEIVFPTDFKGNRWMLRDVRFALRGSTVVQFDGALVGRQMGSGVKWLLNRGKGMIYSSQEVDWDAIEVKTLFGPRHSTGKSEKKLVQPLKSHIRQLKHKLGEVLLTWRSCGREFILPKNVHFMYPRAVLDTVVRTVPLDKSFYTTWQADVERVLDTDSSLDEFKFSELLDLRSALQSLVSSMG